MSEASTSNLIDLAADIVAAYVSNNRVQTAELPTLIASVHSSLQTVSNPPPVQEPAKATPAVPVKKSITPDAIISLIDGKPYKSLKRHLTGHSLTPDQYRQRYGLQKDYPMVAATYAARRSELARNIGLGQNRRKAATKTASTSESVSGETPAKKRGRKKAA